MTKIKKDFFESIFLEKKTDKMAAWDSYISTLKTYYDGIERCGIFGHNGSTWAQENGHYFKFE